MCTYLNKTGGTYHFRRMVPEDLIGHFRTASGNPRLEWKRSLGTKDRGEAKRLLRPHSTETDALIDDARTAIGIPKTWASISRGKAVIVKIGDGSMITSCRNH